MKELTIRTSRHTEFVQITGRLQQVIDESGVKEGVCVAVVPHTTAGITVNENADPDVVADMIFALDQVVPWKSPQYRHGEGNTAAHVKSSMVGHSVSLIVKDGQIQFGTWQGVFFCEFDGPRARKVWVTIR